MLWDYLRVKLLHQTLLVGLDFIAAWRNPTVDSRAISVLFPAFCFTRSLWSLACCACLLSLLSSSKQSSPLVWEPHNWLTEAQRFPWQWDLSKHVSAGRWYLPRNGIPLSEAGTSARRIPQRAWMCVGVWRDWIPGVYFVKMGPFYMIKWPIVFEWL